MNQTIKEVVYGKGNQKHVNFMIDLSGMNEEEAEVFKFIHDGRADAFIMDVMGLSRKSYQKIEDSMRAKLLLAVFECINYTMRQYEDKKG